MDTLLISKLTGFLVLFSVGALSVTVIFLRGIKEGKLQSIAPNENAIRILGLVVILSFTVLLAIVGSLNEGLLAFLGTVSGFMLGGVKKS